MQNGLLKKAIVIGMIVSFLVSSVVSSNEVLKKDEITQLIIDQNDMVTSNDWWNSSWQYRKQITMDHTMVYKDLENFPVLIANVSSDFSDHAQSDGDDFVFIDETNTMQYNHEIEYYNSTSGELIAWVNVTSLNSTVDTELWIYYCNSDCENQENVIDTWGNSYIGVWHMSDITGSDTINDSTDTQDGIKHGDPDFEQQGKIHNSLYFDGSGDYFVITNYAYAFVDSVVPGITIEAWMYLSENRDAIECIYHFGRQNSYPYFSLQKAKSNSPLVLTHAQTGSGVQRAYSNNIGDDLVGKWLHVVGIFDRLGNEIKLYVNGTGQSLIGHCPGYNLNVSGFSAEIGLSTDAGTYYIKGKLDELRISKVLRSASWISTSFNNQNDSISFITFGAEEPHNYIPIADFTYTPGNPIQIDIIQFNDTSSDPDGNITAWFWDFGDGYTSILQNPTHQYVDDGSYNVTLNVTDDLGGANKTLKVVDVSNSLPLADFTYIPLNPEMNESIFFTDNSSDLDGVIVAWLWDFDDGFGSTLQDPMHKYSINGTYNVSLTVTDDDDGNDTIQKTIVVHDQFNNPPYTPYIKGPLNGEAGREYDYTFETTDLDGDYVYYWIEWGDGNDTGWLGPYAGSYEITESHTWEKKDTYIIRAKVKDEHDAESDWGSLKIYMPKNKIPIFNFPVISWLLERFPNAFPILRLLLGLT